jgi:hypothetical protein
VLHRRTLEFDKRVRILRVTDGLECKQAHEVEIAWHFAEACRIQVSGNEISAQCGDRTMRLCMPGGGGSPRVVVGQESPPLGWVSRRFDVKTPTSSVVWSGRIAGAATLVTEMHLPRHGSC